MATGFGAISAAIALGQVNDHDPFLVAGSSAAHEFPKQVGAIPGMQSELRLLRAIAIHDSYRDRGDGNRKHTIQEIKDLTRHGWPLTD
jgi:N-acetylglutamate synthase-like GNAT family acetyltransferase